MLDDRIAARQGGALDFPFPDGSFDVACVQNVGTSIADTAAFYLPLPCATDPADNFLRSLEEGQVRLVRGVFGAQ